VFKCTDADGEKNKETQTIEPIFKGAQTAQRHFIVELTRHQFTIHSEMQDKKADGQEISECKMCEHYFAKESQEDNKEDERKAEKKTEITITGFK
jgi:hypothetical protein